MGKLDHLERTKVPHVTLACFRHGGTHLIMPLVKRLSPLPVVEAGKLPDFPGHQMLGPMVIVWRDPRNRIASMYRWLQRTREKRINRLPGKTTDEKVASLIRGLDQSSMGSGTMVGAMTEFVRTANAKFQAADNAGVPVFQTSFESLVHSKLGPIVAVEIAVTVGAEKSGSEVLAAALGTGHTFTGRHSRWEEWFGPHAREAWEETGGPHLLEIMGYGE